MSEFNKDSLTLEETNALRAKLGLKPLVDDGPAATKTEDGDAPVDSLANQDELAMANYAKRMDEQGKEKEEREARERIAKARNKRELARKLKGATLGDAEPSSSAAESKDTLRWLKQSQKRAKEHAARRAAEQEAEEAQTLAQYGEADLAGLRVGHDVDAFDFAEGQERILTLRDARILDGDGEDELVDNELDQGERDRANAERKRGAKKYTGLDDDQFSAADAGRKRGVLAKYDADLSEKDRGMRMQEEDGGFRLGAPVRDKADEVRKKQEETASMLNKQMLSLDYLKNQAVSDYLQEGDVGFKKPKTKKKKKRTERVKLDLDDDDERAVPPLSAAPDANGDVEMEDASALTPHTFRREVSTTNFVDDDELAASLAKARRAKAKKAFVKMTPEMIARNLKAQEEAEAAERQRAANGDDAGGSSAAANGNGDGGLTIDETSEFVRNISNRPVEEKRRITTRIKREEEDGVRSTASPAAHSPGVRIKKEEGVELGGMDLDVSPGGEEGEYEPGYGAEEGEVKKEEPDAREGLPPAEPETAGAGLAGTLALLRNQGLLQEVTPEQRERERRQLANDAWRAARRREDEAREAEKRASKAQGSAKDQATREWENRQREAEDARRVAEKFKDYQPDVDIKYHDSYGRELGVKEAWKALSHRFHGKDPGHKAQEHTRKRIEQELKKERLLAGDSQGGIEKMFQARAEATGMAHMVLSVGNRGNAPQDMPDLGPNLNAAHASGSGSGSGSGRAARTRTADGTQSVELGPQDSITPLPRALQTGGRTSASPAPRSIVRGTASPVVLGGSGVGVASPSLATSSLTPAASSPAPMRKAGFAPVAAKPLAPSAPSNGEGATQAAAPAPRFKMAFGTKRSAPEGDGGDERAKKRG